MTPVATDDWGPLFADPATSPQLSLSNRVQDYPDPQNWLSLFWTCNSIVYARQVGYCNEDFDTLIAQADAELDPARRLALYEEAGHLLVADAPAVFISNPTRTWLVSPAVSGYAVTPIDFFPESTTPLTLDIAPAA